LKTVIAEIINDLVSNELSIQDAVFAPHLLEELHTEFEARRNKQDFKQAAVGKGLLKKKIKQIRGDQICWVDESTENTALKQFNSFLLELMNSIRQELFVPLKRHESHFALYLPGSFYKKHKDQHKNSPHRQLSCVLYLSSWEEGDGGELLIHKKMKEQRIEPLRGRFVCFLSGKVIHEVLPCKYERKSLTSWMRDDILLPIPIL